MRGRFVSQQVRILLERMDLYPEEFVRPFESRHIETKWNEVLQEGHFNRIEKFLIKRKYVKLKRQATREAIVATIMYDESKQEESFASRFDTVSRMMVTTKGMRDALMNNPYLKPKKTKK